MSPTHTEAGCIACPYSETCSHKFLEALGYLPEPNIAPAGSLASQELAAPILTPHEYRNIKIGANTTITIDLEDLKQELLKSQMLQLFQYGG